MSYEDDMPVTGEVPGDETLMYHPAMDFFNHKSQPHGSVANGHELATRIDDDIVSICDLTIEPNGDNRTFTARHKKGLEVVAITLTVAGVLAVANQIRVRRQK